MKSVTLTFEAKRASAAPDQRRSRKAAGYADYCTPKRRDWNTVFAWSVIGFTSTLIMVGIAFFAYAFAHLP